MIRTIEDQLCYTGFEVASSFLELICFLIELEKALKYIHASNNVTALAIT